MLLFHPQAYDASRYDEPTRRALLAVREFFENKGPAALKQESHDATWYDDFLAMLARERVFATFGTPAEVGGLIGGEQGRSSARWDTARNNDLSQLLAWYSLEHWYAWQVTVLGLGPIWMSGNTEAKALVGRLLAEGGVFAFGLSEQTHGADIYSTDMVLTPDAGGWRASGAKYYIGNGNCAARVAVFGRVQRPGGPSANPADDYLFFLADPLHPAYRLVQNVIRGQMYVSEFRLEDYPVTAGDVLHTGKAAWDAALATVNVGKVQLAWASIGIAEHAFVEAVGHARQRVLYGTRVTDFPHVRRLLADAYVRLLAMKLYSARCSDYERSAAADDRRFLLYNPIAKMKVTSEGERVIDLLWEVIAARGFEKDTYFEQATRHIRTLPKLEGTVHVNLALVLKFLPAYVAAATGRAVAGPPVPVRLDPADDAFLFAQGPASGLSRIGFPTGARPSPALATCPMSLRFWRRCRPSASSWRPRVRRVNRARTSTSCSRSDRSSPRWSTRSWSRRPRRWRSMTRRRVPAAAPRRPAPASARRTSTGCSGYSCRTSVSLPWPCTARRRRAQRSSPAR
jgi:acyl-CoA dehydrogenase